MQGVQENLSPGDWVTSLDLSDAYYHIPLHPKFHKYVSFVFRDVKFFFIAMPMGLCSAPRIFIKICMPIVAFLRLHECHVLNYLDDWSVSFLNCLR